MNSKKLFKTERVLHDLVLASVKDDTFSALIEDVAGLAEYSVDPSPDMFPQFSLDHLTRRALLASGKTVLDSLTMLDLLTSDKNISSEKKEILRPDIVCINPEQDKIIIIEIKNEAQTGREAITELLAYEHELKNTLPMVSNYDVCFVIISPEWSTLMDHSVASAVAWSGRNVLMLTADKVKDGLVLRTRVPTAWSITGNVYFPDEAFPSVTVCLYEKAAYSPEWSKKKADEEEEQIDSRLLTAIDVMAREGDRLGGHGFLVLWKDYSSISLTRYNVTVCGVSPFEFYKATRAKDKSALRGHLSPALDGYIVRNDPQGHAESLIKVAQAAYPILEEVSDPMLEGFHHWALDRETLQRRAIPLRCEFWGVLGKYSRDYVLNPAVREHRRATLLNGAGDWRDPRVGIPLIQSFTRPDIFVDGDVRCTDAFRLGIIIGLDRSLRHSIKSADDALDAWKCRYLWNRFDHMSAIDEIRLLAGAATNVKPPEGPLRFHEDPLADDQEDFDRFLVWLTNDFLQNSFFHKLCFYIGINGAVAFDQRRRGFGAQRVPDNYYEPVKAEMVAFCKSLLIRATGAEADGGLWGDVPRLFTALKKALGLKKKFSSEALESMTFDSVLSVWDLCLELSEHVLEPVFHRHADVELANVDWVWMQQGVAQMRAEGRADAGVILLPNGMLVTGPVMPQGFSMNISITEPDLQVPFLDRSNGFGHMRIVTWEQLKAGEVFNFGSKASSVE